MGLPQIHRNGAPRLKSLHNLEAMETVCFLQDDQDSVKVKNNPSFYISILQRWNCPLKTMLIHGYFIQNGFCLSIVSLWTTLVDMYAKFGLLHDARSVFDRMNHHNVVSWTAMIAGYARCRDDGDDDGDGDGHDSSLAREAMVLFEKILSNGLIFPNEFTISAVVNACANLGNVEDGRLMHFHMVKTQTEVDIDVFVGNALMNMYGKCGHVEDVVRMFEAIKDRDVVTWTALIAGYVNNGLVNEALQAFRQLECEGLEPNEITFVSILGLFTVYPNIGFGKLIHTCLMYHEFPFNLTLQNTLINVYCKCGNAIDGQRVFDKMQKKNVVSWNTMITGYSKDGNVHEVLKLYHRMASFANNVTFISMINLFATIKALECGMAIHIEVLESGVKVGKSLGNSLVDMYVCCERLEDAQWAFDKMRYKDAVSWSTLIVGYCNVEDVEKAIELFCEMEQEGVKPNESTCLTIMTACSSIGVLEKSMRIHAEALKSGNESGILVINAIIHMYVKCGNMYAAYLMFKKLPQRDIVSWNIIIYGLAQHGYGRESLLLIEEMMCEKKLEPSSITFLGILSACNHSGLVEEGFFVFSSMIVRTIEHFACMVDLLARAGRFNSAKELVTRMPLDTTAIIWRTLLTSCRLHFDINLADSIIESMIEFERYDASSDLFFVGGSHS